MTNIQKLMANHVEKIDNLFKEIKERASNIDDGLIKLSHQRETVDENAYYTDILDFEK